MTYEEMMEDTFTHSEARATIDALAKALERSLDLIDGQLVSEAHECMNEAYNHHARVIQLARGG